MRDNQKLEKHFILHDVKPVERFDYKGFDVYISEGGPFHHRERKNEYPLGWYESAYAIGMNDKLLFYQVLEFESLHDIKSMSDNARRQGRINMAKQAAMEHLDRNEKLMNGQEIH